MSSCKSSASHQIHDPTSTATPHAPTLAPALEAQSCEAPWPVMCPTPDCNEHLRAHPHPSAPVLFAACGHSHCGLCAAVVLREPLPQCPTCGVGVVAGQASPNTGLGLYGEAVLHSSSALPTSTSLACVLCAADDTDEPATYACCTGSCDNKPLCCDHSRFHAKKTGHTPVCVEGAPADAAVRGECTVHALPLSHYCMLHSELLCDSCGITKHLSCGVAHVRTVHDAATHFAPALASAVATFTQSADDMLHAIPAITTAKSSMASRLHASIFRFSERIDAVIAALQTHRSRVITAANQKCAEYTKALDSQTEVMSVSASQLHAAVAMAAVAVLSSSPVRILEAHATLKSMAALVKQYDGPAVVPVVEVQHICDQLLDKLGELGELFKVVPGTRLTVVSVSGLELQPGTQQELRVVLSLEDGSVPSWLTDSDLECTVQDGVGRQSHRVLPSLPSPNTGRAKLRVKADATATAGAGRVISHRVGPAGNIVVAYELLRLDVHEVVIQLRVCGVRLGPNGGWRVRRQLTALTSSCVALGTHVRTLPVVAGNRHGLAVSVDEKWLVVGVHEAGSLSVYSLPDGELVRTFGGSGSGPLQFKKQFRLCFAPNTSNLIVVDSENYRLQEVTLEGAFVRFIGEGVWSASDVDCAFPWCVAVWNDVIAVGSAIGTGPRVALLGLASGVVTSRFGEVGTAPGQLSPICCGLRFTSDGSRLVVAEREAQRLSLFTVGGVFLKCIGASMLSPSNNDVCLSAKGEYVVADRGDHRVCVFSADGSELVRCWGSRGEENGQFMSPTALAMVGAHLYVMDQCNARVQVFK